MVVNGYDGGQQDAQAVVVHKFNKKSVWQMKSQGHFNNILLNFILILPL